MVYLLYALYRRSGDNLNTVLDIQTNNLVLLISALTLLVTIIGVYNNDESDDNKYISLMTIMVIVLAMASVQPVEAALILSSVFTLIYVIVLWYKKRNRSFNNKTVTIVELLTYFSEAILSMQKKVYSVDTQSVELKQILEPVVFWVEGVMKQLNPRAEVAISFLVLEPLSSDPEGKFRVVSKNSTINKTSYEKMEARFRWKRPVNSTAGESIAEGKTIIIPDINDIIDGDPQRNYEPGIISGFEEKSIICIPVRNPLFSESASISPTEKYLGVFCISSSDAECLTQSYEKFFEKTLIPTLEALILMHKLSSDQ